MIEDSLEELTGRGYTVDISKEGKPPRWRVALYGEHDAWETGPGAAFTGRGGGDLVELLARAAEWAQEPLASGLAGLDWLRLCELAARTGNSPRDLIRQGVREKLDRESS